MGMLPENARQRLPRSAATRTGAGFKLALRDKIRGAGGIRH